MIRVIVIQLFCKYCLIIELQRKNRVLKNVSKCFGKQEPQLYLQIYVNQNVIYMTYAKLKNTSLFQHEQFIEHTYEQFHRNSLRFFPKA